MKFLLDDGDRHLGGYPSHALASIRNRYWLAIHHHRSSGVLQRTGGLQETRGRNRQVAISRTVVAIPGSLPGCHRLCFQSDRSRLWASQSDDAYVQSFNKRKTNQDTAKVNIADNAKI